MRKIKGSPGVEDIIKQVKNPASPGARGLETLAKDKRLKSNNPLRRYIDIVKDIEDQWDKSNKD
jgi:hypothetical protein